MPGHAVGRKPLFRQPEVRPEANALAGEFRVEALARSRASPDRASDRRRSQNRTSSRASSSSRVHAGSRGAAARFLAALRRTRPPRFVAIGSPPSSSAAAASRSSCCTRSQRASTPSLNSEARANEHPAQRRVDAHAAPSWRPLPRRRQPRHRNRGGERRALRTWPALAAWLRHGRRRGAVSAMRHRSTSLRSGLPSRNPAQARTRPQPVAAPLPRSAAVIIAANSRHASSTTGDWCVVRAHSAASATAAAGIVPACNATTANTRGRLVAAASFGSCDPAIGLPAPAISRERSRDVWGGERFTAARRPRSNSPP